MDSNKLDHASPIPIGPQEIQKYTAEKITLILGAMSNVFLLLAYYWLILSNSNEDEVTWRGLSFLLLHFIFILVALPFLLRSIFRSNMIPDWFAKYLGLETVVNVIFVLLIGSQSTEFEIFVIIGLIEAVPIYLVSLRYKSED
ncbi:MAG: hypothetical protein ACW98K_16425 [Candidatus Kariarchaeaceae archaeon]|jgi:multisubunit Na+/H+ antiporter MnhB subunit